MQWKTIHHLFSSANIAREKRSNPPRRRMTGGNSIFIPTTRMAGFLLVIAVVLLTMLSTDLNAKSPVRPKALQKVGFDQRLNEQVPLDLKFRDEQGRTVQLGELIDKKPVILTLAYFRCPRLCTQVLTGVAHSMRQSGLTLGEDFESITISFDPADSPAEARAKKKTYLKYYGQPSQDEHWHFLTGSRDSITPLTEAVGFHYTYDPKTKLFAHVAGALILTPEGRISRLLSDVKYSGRDLRLGLVEASQNEIGSPTDQVLLFCYQYDPVAGRYGVAIMNFVRLFGVLTILGLVWLFRRLRRHESDLEIPAESEVSAV